MSELWISKDQASKWNKKRKRKWNNINNYWISGILVILKQLAKTTSLHLEALASAHWPVHAPNTIWNKAMEIQDLSACSSCSSSRTSPEISESQDHQISTKCHKLIVIRTVWTCTWRICKAINLTLTVATGSIQKRNEHQTINRDFSLHAQSIHKPQASGYSTMNDLQNAYQDLHNREIRICTLWLWQWWILMFQGVKAPNRLRLMYRKLNAMPSSIQNSSNWKKSHFAINDLALNSPWSWCYCHEFVKTDV